MKEGHEVWSARLDDYLDGSLDRAGAAEVMAHVRACAVCAAELREIEALRERARGLPAEIAPSRDLWAGIARRLVDASAAGSATRVIDIDARRSRARSPRGWLAAAAVVLVALSSGVTALLLRGGEAPLASDAEAGPPRPIGLAAFASAEAEYEYTVSMLEAELAARRDRLLPETIAAVEENLAIIDEAIAEARAALAADPGSPDLPLLLSGVYLQKVELLRKAVDLTART